MKKSARGAAIAVLLLVCPAMAAAQSDLERARSLYNAGMFDESIAAAAVAKKKTAAAPSATLIAARARLELFRQKQRSPGPGGRARGSCFTESARSCAAGNHRVADWRSPPRCFSKISRDPPLRCSRPCLPTARGLPTGEFDKLLEWWASTLSRVAESLSGVARKDAYAAMLSAVRAELERDPLSRPATYWLVVAARGTGDFDGAWNAAVAGWIRAGAQPEGQQLRSDLDRFVTQTLIPERAQSRTGQRLDAKATMSEIEAHDGGMARGDRTLGSETACLRRPVWPATLRDMVGATDVYGPSYRRHRSHRFDPIRLA